MRYIYSDKEKTKYLKVNGILLIQILRKPYHFKRFIKKRSRPFITLHCVPIWFNFLINSNERGNTRYIYADHDK